MLHKNQYFSATCTDYTHEGMGVVRHENIPVFVKDMMVGEIGEIKVVQAKKTYAFGRLIKLTSASKERVKPKCPIAKQCGGCNIQHLSAKEQQAFKTNKVKNTLQRIGKIDCPVHDTIMMENPYFYRNKVQVPFGLDQKGNVVCGFYRLNSNDIIETETCYIQNDISNKLVNRVKELVIKYNVPVYDKIKHKGVLRHVLTKYGFNTDELMLVLITNGKNFKNKEEIIEILTKEFPNLKTIIQNINTRDDNVILGTDEIIWTGNGYIEDTLSGVRFKISSKSFYQINPIQTEVLYQTAIDYADIDKDDVVVDAYCGVGTISLLVSKKAKKVIGVEIIDKAVEDAKENAKLNNITNAEFYVGDAGDFLVDIAEKKERVDVVVMDPPRKGCDKVFLDCILTLKPKKLVYVSCDVSTLARDLNYLSQNGYEVKECQPVDMFPHTHHVENVVLITKTDK